MSWLDATVATNWEISMSTQVRELTADEIDSVNGGFAIVIDLGFVQAWASVNDGGIGGGIKVGDGEMHGGTIWL
jgi:hypothetical protein